MKNQMKFRTMLAASLALSAASMSGIASAQTEASCDRACLQGFAHQLLASMKQHTSSTLPLARWYALTENGSPSSPVMSSLWRTVTDFKEPGAGQYVIDPKTGQLFFVAEVFEGTSSAVFFARLKVENKRIAELELYISRSKGESGQLFDPEGLTHLPAAWTSAVPESKKASRAELTRVGYSVFDKSYGSPEGSKTCELVEMGGVVVEDAEALKAIMVDKIDLSNRALKGGVSVPCTASDRPEDKRVRVIVDEVQGVTVSLGIVDGVVFSSFITPGLESTFVPVAMAAGFERIPKEKRDPNGANLQPGLQAYVPVIRTLPASMLTAEMTKFYGNKVEGVQRYMHMQPVGGGSPWVAR